MRYGSITGNAKSGNNYNPLKSEHIVYLLYSAGFLVAHLSADGLPSITQFNVLHYLYIWNYGYWGLLPICAGEISGLLVRSLLSGADTTIQNGYTRHMQLVTFKTARYHTPVQCDVFTFLSIYLTKAFFSVIIIDIITEQFVTCRCTLREQYCLCRCVKF